MALKDLLAQLPEDFKIKNGETELDRAAILAEFDKEVAPLNTRVTELTTREQELKDQLDAAIAAANLRRDDGGGKKTEATDPRQIAQDALRALFEQKDEYDFNDPYSKQVLSRVEKMVKEATSGVSSSQAAELEELKKGNMGLAAMVLMHQMNADFAAHKWPEGYDASKAWSEAIRQGYIDPNTKLPNVARFNRELMAPIEAKTAADKRYEEGIEAGKKLAQEELRARQTGRGRLGLVPRPGGGPTGGGKQGNAAAPRNLAEAIDQIAISDADIAANTGLRAG